MGWVYTLGATRKSIIQEIIQGGDRVLEDGSHVSFKCLAHCYRGGNFRGVLWSVWEVIKTDKEGKIETQRFIGCDVLDYHKNYGWGYKSMDESAHPYYYSCPLKYLKMVPTVCQEWRDEVLKHHEERRKKQEKKKQKRLTWT